MAVHLGTLLLELQLDGAKFHQDLEAARRSAMKAGEEIEKSLKGSSGKIDLPTLTPKVDDRALTALNKHLDLKEKHFLQVGNAMKVKPLAPKVNATELDELTRKLEALSSRQVNIQARVLGTTTQSQSSNYSASQSPENAAVGSTAVAARLDAIYKQLQDNKKSSSEDSIKITRVIHSSSKQSLGDKILGLPGRVLDSLTTGFTEGVGTHFSFDFARGMGDYVEKKTGKSFYDTGRSTARFGYNRAKGFGEVGAAALGYRGGLRDVAKDFEYVQKKVDDFLNPRKFVKAIKKFEDTLVSALEDVYVYNKPDRARAKVGKYFEPSVEGVKEAGLRAAGVGVRAAAQPFRIRKRVQLAQSMELAQQLSEKISVPDLEDPESVKTIALMTGGVDFQEGGRNTYFARNVLKNVLGKGTATIPVPNAYSNSDELGGLFELRKGIAQLIAKVTGKEIGEDSLKAMPVDRLMNLAVEAGYNPDAIKLEATRLAYERKYPDKKFVFAGTSGGTVAAEEATAIAERGGAKNTKGFGATLGLYGLTQTASAKNFQAFVGDQDPLYMASFGTKHIDKTKLSKAQLKILEESLKQLPIPADMLTGLLAPSRNTTIVPGAGVAHHLGQFMADAGTQEALVKFLGTSGASVAKEFQGKDGTAAFKMYADMYGQLEALQRTFGVLRGDAKATAELREGKYAFVTEDKQLRKTYGESQEKPDLEYAAAEFEPSKRIKGVAAQEGQAFKKVMQDIIAILQSGGKLDASKIEEAYESLQKIFGVAPEFNNDAVPFHPQQYHHLAALNMALGGSAVEGELAPFEAQYVGSTDRTVGFTDAEQKRIYKIVKNHLLANLQSMFGVGGMMPVSIESIQAPPPVNPPSAPAAVVLPKKQMTEAENAYRETARLTRLQQQQVGLAAPSANPDSEALRRIIRDRNSQIKGKVENLKQLVADGLTEEAEKIGKEIISGIAEARATLDIAIEQGLEAPLARAAKGQLTRTESSLKREWQAVNPKNTPRNTVEQIYQQEQAIKASPTFKQRFIAMLAQRRSGGGGTGGNEAGIIDPRLLGANLIASGIESTAKLARQAIETANASVVGGLQNIIKALSPIEMIKARQKTQLDKSAQMVLKRADEIQKELGAYSQQAKSIIVASGGFAGQRGKTSKPVSERIGKLAGADFITESVDNIATDTSVAFSKKIPFILQVIGKALKHNILKAYNPDAIEMAAKGLALHRQTGLPVNYVGYSAGGYVAREAQQISERVGLDTKAAGIGTPLFNTFGSDPAKFQAFMGQGDILAPLVNFFKRFRGADPAQVMLSNAGEKHHLANYLGSEEFHNPLFSFLGRRRTNNQPVSPQEFAGGGLDPFSKGGGTGGSPPPPRQSNGFFAGARQIIQSLSPQNIAQAAKDQAATYAKAFQEKLKEMGKDLGEFQEFEVRTEHPLENIPIIGGSVSFMLDSLEAMKGMATFAPKVGRAFAGLADGILKNSKLITNLVIGFVSFQMVLKPILGLLDQFVNASMEVAMRFESLEQAIKFTTGAQGAMNVKFAKDEAVRTGGDIETGMRGFSGLSASARNTSLEGEGVRDLYSAVSQASAVYAVSPERQQNAFVALQQMIDKNQLSLEELRGQLAEALPSSIGVAARAYGMSPQEFSKRVESGEVRADEFIPRFSQQLAAETSVGVAGSQNTSQAATNRLNNQMLLLQESVGDLALPMRNAAFNTFAKTLEFIAEKANLLNQALGFVAFVGLRQMLVGTVDLLIFLLKIPAAANLIVTGVAKIGAMLRGLLPMLQKAALQFAVLSAIVNLWHVISTGMKDSSGVIGQAADDINGRLDRYKQSIGESTDKTNGFIQSLKNMGETLGNVKAKSLMEETVVGGLFKAVLGEEAGAGLSRVIERGAQNSARFVEEKVFGEAMTRTYAQKRAEDNIIQTGSAITGAETTLSQLNSLFGVDGKVGTQIAELQRIDEELRQNSLQRQALDPADTDARRVLGEQRNSLIEAREAANRPIAELREMVAADVESLKQVRDELTADLESGAFDTEENVENRAQMVRQLEQVNSLLEAQEKGQARINGQISNSVSRVQLLRREFEQIKAVSADRTIQLQMEAATNNTEILQAEAERGNPNQARLAEAQNRTNQQRLNAQIAANQQEISRLQSQLLDSETQNALTQAGFNTNTGANEIRAYANDPARPDGELKQTLLNAADIREQLSQRQIDTSTLQGEVAQAQITAQQTLKDVSLQVADFYRSIERSAQDAQNSIKQSDMDAVATSAKARLTRSLSKFGDTFFDEFVGGLADILDQMFEPVRIHLQQMQQTAAINNQVADITLQGSRMVQNMAPQAGDSLTGAVIPGATGNGQAVRSGLWTGESANIGGSSAFHIDTKINNNQSWEQVVGYFDQLARGYAAENRRIEFSNSAVAGEVYDVNATLAEKIELLQRAAAAHSHSVSQGYRSFDYYVPLQGRTRFDRSGNNNSVRAEMLLPNIPGARLDYDSGGRYGNYVRVLDANGNQIMRQGHGDDSRALPSDRAMSAASTPVPQATAPRPQAVPAARPQVATSSLSTQALFEGGSNSLSARIVGISEGTRTADGGRTRHYAGHTDPGNGVRNMGSFSYQHGANTGDAADNAWNEKLREVFPRFQQAAQRSGLNPNDPTLAFSFLDFYTQSPRAAENWLERLPQLAQSGVTPENIARTRVASFEGSFSRRAFGDEQGLYRDQLRRTNAVQTGIQANNLSAGSAPAPGQTQYPGMPGVNPGYQMGVGQVNQGMNIAGQSASDQIAAVERLAAAQQDMASANLARSLTQQRQGFERSLRTLDDQITGERQQQEQAAYALLGDSPVAQRLQRDLGQSQEFENQNRDLLRNIQTAEQSIEMFGQAKIDITNAIEVGRASGTPEETIRQYEEFLTSIDQTIAGTEERLAGFRSLLENQKTAFDLRDQVEQEELDRERQLGREGRLRQSANLMLQQQANEASANGNEIGASVIQNRMEVAGIGDRYAEQIAPLEQQLRDIETWQAKLEEAGLALSAEDLEQVQAETAYLNEQIEDLTRHRDIEVEMTLSGLDRIREQLNDTLQQDFTESAATYMESRNDTFGAQALREEFAVGQENERYQNQVAGIEALRESTRYTNEGLDALLEKARQTNELNLENIDAQFKDLGETLADIGKNSLGTFFNDILTGSKSAGEAFKDLISNILSQVAQLAVNALMKDIFGGGGGLGGLFGGGQQQAGGGGLGSVLGGLFGAGQSMAAPAASGGGMGGTVGTIMQIGSMLIGGMKEGGEVAPLDHSAYRAGYGAISEALHREGSNSVLSALTPGETVLTVEQSRKYKQMGGEEIFNFKKGGTVPGGRSVPKAPSSGSSEGKKGGDINVPISVNVNGQESDYDIPAFKQVMEAQIQSVIQKESRPGGTLHRRS